MLYKVQSYGKTFYEIFSFNSWKSVKYLCRNVTIDQRMTIFKSSNSRDAHSRCARYFIFRLGHNITMFLYQKVWKRFRKIALHKTQLAHCSAIRLDIFTSVFRVLVLFLSDLLPLKFLTFRNKQTSQNQKNHFATLERRKLSRNKHLLSQEFYESNRDFLARIARLDLSPRGFNIFYKDIITL